MDTDLKLIMKLREETSKGLYQCKIALESSNSYEEAKFKLNKIGVTLLGRRYKGFVNEICSKKKD